MPTATRKHRSNPEWIRRHLTDPYVKQATQLGYRSRAAFKLIEIDDREKLLKPGLVVVDLGAAPGSWTQVARERMRRKDGSFHGTLVALDILPMEALPDVEFIQGDFREEAVAEGLAKHLDGRQPDRKIDVVLSDLSPNLSGIAAADAARGEHLAELAIEFCVAHLAPNGAFVLKAFQGSGYSQIVERLKRTFRTVAVRKPPASRAESAETYLVARGLK